MPFYDRVPKYFYTDQYDLSRWFPGYAGPGGYDQVVFRGERGQARVHRVLDVGRGGVVSTGMNVNIWTADG